MTVPGGKDVRACPFQPKDVVDSQWRGVVPFVHRGERWIGGGVVDLAHLSFGLTRFNTGRCRPGWNYPGNPLRGSLQKPSFVGWELKGD